MKSSKELSEVERQQAVKAKDKKLQVLDAGVPGSCQALRVKGPDIIDLRSITQATREAEGPHTQGPFKSCNTCLSLLLGTEDYNSCQVPGHRRLKPRAIGLQPEYLES
jgi:hypothetical protein